MYMQMHESYGTVADDVIEFVARRRSRAGCSWLVLIGKFLVYSVLKYVKSALTQQHLIQSDAGA